ncbi:MAG TPA: ATP/GTP-binding protein [Candidatus Thermoplasmatota archaeon]|nr:ATP/GTP-binding protein [Candidatus Thermoplasmatota archaeon]
MVDADPIFVYVVGTAGSGKSRFTAGFQRFLKERGIDCVTLNLDPGAEMLPYQPDVDIRDWIRLSDVMDQYELGPNGAQIMAADLIALRLGEIEAVLNEFRGPVVLVDTPGQTELFVFRESGRITMELLAPGRSAIIFLMDPFLAKRPSAFVSMLMLSATTQFRFQVPLINVISKRDILKAEELERITSWSEDADALEDALVSEKPDLYTQMTTDAFRVLDAMQGVTKAYAVSGESLEGMEDVYGHLEGLFRAGEDLQSD